MKIFQQDRGLVVDGIVGPLTWNALPDGGPMPTLKEGFSGDVVRSMQTVLNSNSSSIDDPGWIEAHRLLYRRFSPNKSRNSTVDWFSLIGFSDLFSAVELWRAFASALAKRPELWRASPLISFKS